MSGPRPIRVSAVPVVRMFARCGGSGNGRIRTRRPVWTEAWIGSADEGWIASHGARDGYGGCLAREVGVDETIATVIEQIRALDGPWNGYGVLAGTHCPATARPTPARAGPGGRSMPSRRRRSPVTWRCASPPAGTVSARSPTIRGWFAPRLPPEGRRSPLLHRATVEPEQRISRAESERACRQRHDAYPGPHRAAEGRPGDESESGAEARDTIDSTDVEFHGESPALID
jgi:hypothetical protein